jgi:hypothetical protein
MHVSIAQSASPALCMHTMHVSAASAGEGVPEPARDPALIVAFVTTPGTGKSAICAELARRLARRKKRYTVVHHQSDALGAAGRKGYWDAVGRLSVTRRNDGKPTIVLADKNLVDNPPGAPASTSHAPLCANSSVSHLLSSPIPLSHALLSARTLLSQPPPLSARASCAHTTQRPAWKENRANWKSSRAHCQRWHLSTPVAAPCMCTLEVAPEHARGHCAASHRAAGMRAAHPTRPHTPARAAPRCHAPSHTAMRPLCWQHRSWQHHSSVVPSFQFRGFVLRELGEHRGHAG